MRWGHPDRMRPVRLDGRLGERLLRRLAGGQQLGREPCGGEQRLEVGLAGGNIVQLDGERRDLGRELA